MEIAPYLLFKGDCEKAFRFYERCLKGKIVAILPFEGTPAAEHMPSDLRGKILHARLTAGNFALMGSDAPPERYEVPKGISVSLGIEDPDEAERVFKELSENATVTMPIQQTFWAYRFGMLTDQFGIPWMVNCEKAKK